MQSAHHQLLAFLTRHFRWIASGVAVLVIAAAAVTIQFHHAPSAMQPQAQPLPPGQSMFTAKVANAYFVVIMSTDMLGGRMAMQMQGSTYVSTDKSEKRDTQKNAKTEGMVSTEGPTGVWLSFNGRKGDYFVANEIAVKSGLFKKSKGVIEVTTLLSGYQLEVVYLTSPKANDAAGRQAENTAVPQFTVTSVRVIQRSNQKANSTIGVAYTR